jgi:hypothetical protein
LLELRGRHGILWISCRVIAAAAYFLAVASHEAQASWPGRRIACGEIIGDGDCRSLEQGSDHRIANATVAKVVRRERIE